MNLIINYVLVSFSFFFFNLEMASPLPAKVQQCPVINGKYKTDHNEIADFKTEFFKGRFKYTFVFNDSYDSADIFIADGAKHLLDEKDPSLGTFSASCTSSNRIEINVVSDISYVIEYVVNVDKSIDWSWLFPHKKATVHLTPY